MTIYTTAECAVFFKTREEFGELSNMANDFPLMWEGRKVGSSEALYQAHKFYPQTIVGDISPFAMVISQKNSMVSKMKAKKYREYIRPDWHHIKFDVMNYCVRLKYQQHKETLNRVLKDTENKLIVEKSRKDQLWGAVNDYCGNLIGENILGCLWMIIRDELPEVSMPATIV